MVIQEMEHWVNLPPIMIQLIGVEITYTNEEQIPSRAKIIKVWPQLGTVPSVNLDNGESSVPYAGSLDETAIGRYWSFTPSRQDGLA